MPKKVDNKSAVDSKNVFSVLKSNKAWAFLGGFVVVVLAAGLGWFITGNTSDSNNQTTSTEPSLIDTSPRDQDQPYEYGLEQISFETLKTRVEQYTFTGQYSEAAEQIRYQEYFDESQEAHQLLASVYINGEAYNDALEALLAAEEKFGIDKGIAENIADVAIELDNTELAREYLQKAISYIESNSDDFPLADEDIEAIENKIEQL